ncbi:glycosylphosphatidylinositol anchor attachment 1 protein [Toxorhynchites rutilus septentrionalis]|uniref:glycosylphosphatidylinositol anchor attachment 1 protein n=1 Tax=Toxorhynchites rutilus septentrionalis TaxID=329112 RepID=UPI00247867FE|nr:glycosylphosphatidylinositol anchor attachment 1 protein [Toxorhynchites rutilus septentrionalis]
MGLLTNPSISQKARYCKALIRNNTLICLALYLLGVGYFFLLPDPNFNSGTYFSENALLPGLVYSELKMDTVALAKSYAGELERERENHRKDMPYAWLLAKMRKIGLETHSHNFTLNYPLGGGKVFSGKNVYGILRAPRIGSTESFVISVPYRTPESVHTDVSAGIPLILAFADFARRQKYWAKDIIFLITEQEQLGMQAWLEAYHGSESDRVLNAGSLNARAGAIQAAINLEVQDFDVDHINLKLEGLNGQLPNLDLHNLAQKLSQKNGIPAAYRLSATKKRKPYEYCEKFENLLAMVFSQSTGVPTGNHGLFHRYGIEALTLECVKQPGSKRGSPGVGALLKIVEGISRSLNNLLERFHQSYFFYLLVTHDRFVSIGDYMPSLGLMAGALLIKSFIHYLSLYYSDDLEPPAEEEEDSDDAGALAQFNFVQVGFLILLAHSIGALTTSLPFNSELNSYLHDANLSTQFSLFTVMVCVSLLVLILPAFVTLDDFNSEVLQIAILLELGTVLLAVGMLNFSLGLILSVVTVPVVLLLQPRKSGFLKGLSRFFCVCLHPLVFIYLVLFGVTLNLFPELVIKELLKKALPATMDAITYSVVDSMIYGNWLFNLVALIFLPTWTLLWCTMFTSRVPKK